MPPPSPHIHRDLMSLFLQKSFLNNTCIFATQFAKIQEKEIYLILIFRVSLRKVSKFLTTLFRVFPPHVSEKVW